MSNIFLDSENKKRDFDWLNKRKRISLNDISKTSFNELLEQNPDIKFGRQFLFHVQIESFKIPECPICHGPNKWHPDFRQYRQFCSRRCSSLGTVEQRMETSKLNHGGVYHTKTKEYLEKVQDTSKERFGATHHNKTKEGKSKRRKTCYTKFGGPGPACSEEVQKKMKQTTIKRYGVEHAIQNEEIKEKFKNVIFEKYGVSSYTQTDEFKDKTKITCLKKYGVEHPMKDPEINSRAKETRRINHYPPKTLEKLEDLDWLREQQKTKTVHRISKELGGISPSHLGKHFRKHGIVLNNVNAHQSDSERDINTFINGLGFETITNSKSIISPKEIDIFIPNKNLAIEFNGLYYHREGSGRIPKYHLNKTLDCKDKNIDLLHILDFEWDNPIKQDIWKSMIKSKLGILSNRIYARNCKIQEVSTVDANNFMNDNHISGFVGGKYKLGLYHDDVLVQCIIISKSRFTKKYDYELIRLASKKHTVVIGGLSKLLSHIPINGNLITYADRRYSTGNAYLASGFEFIKTSPPNYHYIQKPWDTLYSRHQFQKHKLSKILENFDNNLTEWENMQNNNWDRFWDCGTVSFKKELNNI